MKKILGYYGITIISVLVAFGVYMILFELAFENRQNFQSMLGRIIEEQVDSHDRQIKLGTAFDAIADHPLPTISLTNTDAIIKGQKTALSAFLSAHDRYGRSVNVSLKGVWDEELKKDTSVQLISGTHLLFAKNGIYWLEVSAMDTEGYHRTSMVRIYVKEG